MELADFRYAGTNITGLRLVKLREVSSQVEVWKEDEAKQGRYFTGVTAHKLSVSQSVSQGLSHQGLSQCLRLSVA